MAKEPKERGGLLIEKGGGEGPLGNFAFLLPPADRKQGRGRHTAVALGRRPGGAAAAKEGGARGDQEDSIPYLGSGRGAARRAGDGGGRRAALERGGGALQAGERGHAVVGGLW